MIRKWKILLAVGFLCCSAICLMGQKNNTESIPVSFESEGFSVAGRFFSADGTAPFPTVILLHGFPGGNGDLFGLGQRLNREGINAFTFNYRGTWGSEGLYLPSTSLEDVKSAIRFLKSPSTVATFSIDTTRLSIVGYSYGGGMALLGSVFDPAVKKVVSIAGGNLDVIADQIENNLEYRRMHQQLLDECMADSAMVRGLGGKASHEWLLKNRQDYGLVEHARELSTKKILLIGGWRDRSIVLEDHILPLFRAIQKYSAENSKIEVYDTDHSFEGYKDRLTGDIIRWLKD